MEVKRIESITGDQEIPIDNLNTYLVSNTKYL